jgi:hypothetical protein
MNEPTSEHERINAEWDQLHREQLKRRGLDGRVRRRQKCWGCGKPITGWSCDCGVIFDD